MPFFRYLSDKNQTVVYIILTFTTKMAEYNQPYLKLRTNIAAKNGMYPVALVVTINRKQIQLNTGISATLQEFDPEQRRIIGRSNSAKERNYKLDRDVGRASEIMQWHQVNNKTLTAESFKSHFKNPQKFDDFIEYMLQGIEDKKGTVSDGTIKHHKVAYNKLKEFRASIAMSELSYELFEKFEKFLKKKGNSQNTITNNMKKIMEYVNDAVKKEVLSKHPAPNWKMKKQHSNIQFLSNTELLKLQEYYRSNRATSSVRTAVRTYLFCCETGLRISDVNSITISNIEAGNLLRFVPVKSQNVTNRELVVPLTAFAVELIADSRKAKKKNNRYLFNDYAEGTLRKYLKLSMREIGITRNMTFHTSRHTFATKFLSKSKQANGILILQRLLGHSSINTTMRYLHIRHEDLIKGMNQFEEE